MTQISSFTFISLDGYYEGAEKGDISWHSHGQEEGQFSAESLKPGGILLFGRRTYDMMANWWPTPMAKETMPEVAAGMNKAQKIVFSTSMQHAAWENTRIIGQNMVEELQKLKAANGPDMTLLGSGDILRQLSDARLIDTCQIMVDPVVLGKGKKLFEGVKERMDLKLTDTRIFKSGVMLMVYERK